MVMSLIAMVTAMSEKSDWDARIGLYGYPELMDVRQQRIADAIAHVPGARLVSREYAGASPAARFAPGQATVPVIGGEELPVASDGDSHTSTGTMAVALLVEIEQPRHESTRFSVGDA